MGRYLQVMFAALFLLLGSWTSTPAATSAADEDEWHKCFGEQGITLDDATKVTKHRSIYPDVLPHHKDHPYLSARLTSPTFKFQEGQGDAAQSKALAACYTLGDDESEVSAINIRSIEHIGRGTAKIELDLPDEDFSWFKGWPIDTVELAVASREQGYVAWGSFDFTSKAWAFVAATLLTLGGVYGFKQLRGFHNKKNSTRGKNSVPPAQEKPGTSGAWWMGLIIGQDEQPSLSLFQILIWTVLTAWSLLFVFFNTGNLLTMTNQVMVLLGFAGVGSLTARWIASGRQLSKPSPANKDDPPRFWAMLEAEGSLDLFKVQLLLFTVLIAGYVAFRIIRQSAFPELDPQFLLLMGVSNGLYVGTKFTQTSPLAIAGARKIELDALLIEKGSLEAKQEDLVTRLQDIDGKLSDPAIEQTPLLKEQLESKKRIVAKEIEEVKDAHAKAVTAIEVKTSAYKKALEAATQS